MSEKYGKKVREMMVKEMKAIFSDNKGFILSSISNIKASEIDSLRKKIRQSGSKHLVLKNRLAGIALREVGIEELSAAVKEKSILGISVIKEDPVQVAKLLAEFSKKNKGFKVTKGYLEGQVLTTDKVKELADLPGREQLLAMLFSTMNGPIRGFVGVLAATIKSVLYALNAIKDKKEEDK